MSLLQWLPEDQALHSGSHLVAWTEVLLDMDGTWSQPRQPDTRLTYIQASCCVLKLLRGLSCVGGYTHVLLLEFGIVPMCI